MKKLLAILSCAVMLTGTLAFTACGGNDNKAKSGEQGTTPAIPNGITLNEITDPQEMYDTLLTFSGAIYGYYDEDSNYVQNDFAYTLDYGYDFNSSDLYNNYSEGQMMPISKTLFNSKCLLNDGIGYGKSYNSYTYTSYGKTVNTENSGYFVQLYDNDYKLMECYDDNEYSITSYQKNVEHSHTADSIMYRQTPLNDTLFDLSLYITYLKSDGNIYDNFDRYGRHVVTMSCTMKADSTKLYLETEYSVDYNYNEDDIATACEKRTRKLYLDIAPNLKKEDFEEVKLTEEEKQEVAYFEVEDQEQFIKDFKDGKAVTLIPSGNTEAALNIAAAINYTYDGKPGYLSKWIEGSIWEGNLKEYSIYNIEEGKLILADDAYSNLTRYIGEDFDESKLSATLLLFCDCTTLGIKLF